MKKSLTIESKLEFEPLGTKNWQQFERLFGKRGGCGGCWCMAFRLRTAEFENNKYEGNRKLMKQLVKNGEPTGLLAIQDNDALGWVSMAPREQFVKLENSRIHKRIDDQAVWSITCFFIRREFRDQGL